MKRYLIIGGVVIGVVVILLGGYLLQKRLSSPATGSSPEPITSNSGSLPSVPAQIALGTNQAGGALQKFGVVTQEKVRDFFIDSQSALFAIQPDGRAFKMTSGGVSMISDSPIGNLSRASFSYDGKRAFVVFGEQSSQQTSVFTVGNATWQPLPAAVQNPSWSPNSSKLMFFSVGPDYTNLSTLDFSLKNPIPQALVRLHQKDMVASWPRPDTVVIGEKPSSLVGGSLYAYSIKTGTMTSLVADQQGLSSIWSPDADRGLLFVGGPTTRGNRMMLVDFSGKTVPLSIVTLPSKCVFGSESSTLPSAPAGTKKQYLICAMPRSLQGINASRLLDLYEERAFYTTDDFIKIDLETGNVSAVWNDSAFELDATDLKLFNGRVYFINRYDDRVYTIALE